MSKKSVILNRYLKIEIEKVAAGTITPGMLVELTSADKVQAHSTEAGNAVKMFAREDGIVGAELDDNYVALGRVPVILPTPGDEVLAILADGETVVIGDLLSSNGDGTLKKHVPESSDYYAATDVTVKPLQIVAQATEAVTASGNTRIEVRIV